MGDLFDKFPRVQNAVLALQAKTQAPLELIVAVVLSAMALMLQRLFRILLPNGKVSPPSLYFVISAGSGFGKSPVEKYVYSPIKEFDEQSRRAAIEAEKEYAAGLSIWRVNRDATIAAIKKRKIKGQDCTALESELALLEKFSPSPPKVKRYLFDNITASAVLAKLHAHGGSIGLISDDAASQLLGAAFEDAPLFAQIWDSRTISVDRVSSPSFVLDNPALTICVMLQTGLLKKAIDRKSGALKESGLAARCLFAMPESTQGTRFYSEQSHQMLEGLAEFQRAIGFIANLPDRENFVQVDFSPEGRRAWVQLHDAIEAAQAPGRELAEICDAASKMADNVARLAAILHLFEEGPGTPISEDAVRCAERLGWHFLDNFKRVFGSQASVPQAALHAEQIVKWIHMRCMREGDGSYFCSRSLLLTNGPNHLRNAALVNAALEALYHMGRARVVRHGRTHMVHLFY